MELSTNFENLEDCEFMAGKYTQILGERLKERLEKDGYEVFYDHGDQKHRIVAYFKDYSRRYFLSFIDIAVVRNEEVKVLCEIEETSSNPKKVLGDLISILLAEKLRYGSLEYYVISPYVVLGLYAKEKGVKRYQTENILNRFCEIFGVDRGKIVVIFAEDLDWLIDLVEKTVLELI
jgi:hypothetical protein